MNQMTDQERLEELEDLFEDISNDMIPPYVGITCDTVVDVKWVIKYAKEQAEQIDSMAHVIKVKNREMRELRNFLKERNIPLKKLSPLITIMNHVQELEEQKLALIEEMGQVDERFLDLEQQNKKLREALEFYADRKTYERRHDPYEPLDTDINDDRGERARKALEESK